LEQIQREVQGRKMNLLVQLALQNDLKSYLRHIYIKGA